MGDPSGRLSLCDYVTLSISGTHAIKRKSQQILLQMKAKNKQRKKKAKKKKQKKKTIKKKNENFDLNTKACFLTD